MTQQLINIGTNPNDGTGDPLRTAFSKTNSNFTDLYTTSYATNVVNTFNSRTGSVTLTSSDVTSALTYTPLNKAGDTATGIVTFAQGWVASALSTASLNTGGSSIPTVPSGTSLRVIGIDGTVGRFVVDSYISSTSPAATISLRGSRGTGAAPSAINSGDTIATIGGIGFGATTFQSASTAAVMFAAEGSSNFTDASQPTGIVFSTTATGSITKAEKMRLNSYGQLLVEGGVAAGIGNFTTTGGTNGTLLVTGSGGLVLVSGNANIGGNLYVGAGVSYGVPATITTNTTLSQTNHIVLANPTAGITVTLPTTNASLAGTEFKIINLTTFLITLQTSSSQTISGFGQTTGTTNTTLLPASAQYQKVTLITDGNAWYVS